MDRPERAPFVRRRASDLRRAFTLVETMAVMAIVGIILLAVVPAIDNMLPSYRLNGGTRTIASHVELAQSEAIGRRAELIMAYDLDENTYWIVLPPEPEEPQDPALVEEEQDKVPEGQTPRPKDDVEHGKRPPDPEPVDEDQAERTDFSDRDALTPTKLPDDVVFSTVIVGDEEKRAGRVYVRFTHAGDVGTHSVGLKLQVPGGGDDGAEAWMKYNALTRTIEYHDQRPMVKTLEGGGY